MAKQRHVEKRMDELRLGDIVVCPGEHVNGKVTNLFRRGDRLVHASLQLDFRGFYSMGRYGILLKEGDTVKVLASSL